MKWVVALVFTALLAVVPCEAAPKKHTAKKAAGPRASSRSAKKTPAHAVASRMRGKKQGHARASAGPAVQARPDPERYQQIQQALAERGYYKGEVNGEWNADSVDALTRFQADQKMEPDGKINSLSLIGLGLGPKHEGSALAAAPPPRENPTSPPSN